MHLHPALTFRQLKGNNVVTGFHASESPNFQPNDKNPLHIGSIQQSKALIRNMTRKDPNLRFFLYQLKVNIKGMAPILYDEDPIGVKRGTSAAYVNRVEFPQGLRFGDNLSLVLFKPTEQIIACQVRLE
jgi:hypothetical protein